MSSTAFPDLSGESRVFFLNAVLSLGCSLCIFIGLWPFKGLFHAWFYKYVPYYWHTHCMMGWFDVGCIGLFSVNVFAYRDFNDSTTKEAIDLVYVLNAVMHGLWGAHNLNQYYRRGVLQRYGRGISTAVHNYPFIFTLWSVWDRIYPQYLCTLLWGE